MKQLNADGTPTSEEFDYAYDLQGRLTGATFAMTPQTGQTGYSTAYPAATRGRAFYDYDLGGRLNSVEHYWDTWVPPTENLAGYYTSAAILGNSCTYDAYKGLKTTSSFWSADPNTGTWKTTPDRTETYGYDPSLDYLTSVDYGDGLPNAQQTWTYDAAGNRASDSVQGSGWTYDNLNRITASPGFTYDHDLAGNRLHRYAGGSTETTYGWDEVGRLLSIASNSISRTFGYRADGLRVATTEGATSVRYRYEGITPIQDVNMAQGTINITSYKQGPRGIEFSKRAGSIVYPLYDSHGNSVAEVQTAGGTYSLINLRSFGVWGESRQNSDWDGDKGYSANIGHSSEKLVGLIYMRAWFQEAGTGRFLSEDPSRRGSNWYEFCHNDPVCRIDPNGKDDPFLQRYLPDVLVATGIATILMGCALSRIGCVTAIADAVFLLAWAGVENTSMGLSDRNNIHPSIMMAEGIVGLTIFTLAAAGLDAILRPSDCSIASVAIGVSMVYVGFLTVFISMELMQENPFIHE